ncbi:hypothetical protein [Flagellimonas sp. S3867]|uniref:hypothetical protein n=1 Tax=Flagellimonas sp. S3867 TaxID=2768063 RepID=UPI001CC25823|nr:hypothetical protein [Flagellimonas sp. S3867]
MLGYYVKPKILPEEKNSVKECKVMIAVSLLLICVQLTFAQVKNNESEYYKWFDEVTGTENSNLYEGTLVVEEYVFFKDSHRFFSSSEYLSGNVVYGGESYFNIEMKYDLYEDQVLLGLRSDVGLKMLRLVKDRIDEFVIGEHKFKKIDCEKDKTSYVHGFQEILIETTFFSFFKKNSKQRYTRYEGNRIYHEFVSDNKYTLGYKGSCYNIKSKKDIVKIFPEYKSQINRNIADSYRKVNKELYLIKILGIVSDLEERKREL